MILHTDRLDTYVQSSVSSILRRRNTPVGLLATNSTSSTSILPETADFSRAGHTGIASHASLAGELSSGSRVVATCGRLPGLSPGSLSVPTRTLVTGNRCGQRWVVDATVGRGLSSAMVRVDPGAASGLVSGRCCRSLVRVMKEPVAGTGELYPRFVTADAGPAPHGHRRRPGACPRSGDRRERYPCPRGRTPVRTPR